MSPPRPGLPVLGLLALLAACAGVRHQAVTPLRDAKPQPVRLDVVAQPGLGHPLEGRFEPVGEDRPVVDLRARFLGVTSQALHQALGDSGGSLFAVVCPREEARRLEVELLDPQRGGGVEQNEMTLALQEGQDGYVSVINQEAYIAGFEVLASANGTIADPRVAVIEDGVLLQVRAQRLAEGEGWSLDLELTCAELDRPFAQRSLDLMGSGPPVTLQMPSGVVRRLTCEASPSAAETLILGGRAVSEDEQGRALVVLLELEPASERDSRGEDGPDSRGDS